MMLDTLLLAAGILAAVTTVPGSLTLALLSLAALLPARATPAGTAPDSVETGRLALLVPAHDEAESLPRSLPSLIEAVREDAHADLWVIADNCTDDTAAVAVAAGASVMVRQSDTKRGKGHALEYAFERLAAQDYAWIIVIDADSTVDRNFVTTMRRAMQPGREALQACYLSRPAVTLRGRVARMAQWGYNLVRPLGRTRLGCSAGLLGNGFALRRSLTTRMPYCAHSVVEDLEYHLMLLAAGVRVHFVREAQVLGEIAETGTGARTQRTRWEGGRLRMVREQAWPLLRQALRGRTGAVDALADLLLLPLGMHLLLVLCALILGGTAGVAAGVLGSLALALYLLAILLRGPTRRSDLIALAASPLYLLWKIALLPATLAHSRRGTAWTRARRNLE